MLYLYTKKTRIVLCTVSRSPARIDKYCKLFQNAMKLKMNGKRSLSPNASGQNFKHWKQNNSNYNGTGDMGEMFAERRKLPMWAAKESFLKEISK